MKDSEATTLPTPQRAAQAVVHALASALRRRLTTADRETLTWFETSTGSPIVDVDESMVAEFAVSHWRGLHGMVVHDNPRVRQASLWAMATTRRPQIVTAILRLLMDQRHHFDHDYAYGAARAMGAPLVAPLRKVALSARGLRRTFAIECLGMTRAGKPAVAAMRHVVAQEGFVPGVLNALYNVAHEAVVPVAAKALGSDDPQQRQHALMAMCGGCSAGFRPSSALQRQRLTAAVLRAMADPRTWREPRDPWASLLGFGLDVLDHLDKRSATAFARQCLLDGAHADSLEELASRVPRSPRRAWARRRR